MIDFAKLRQEIPIADILIWRGYKFTRSGKTLRAQCQLCNHKSKRAFVVTSDKGLWFCFNCREGGDGIEYIALVERISKVEAAHLIRNHFKGP